MEKTAEQAWKDNAFNLGHSTDYVRGISDYKQALRQAIENRKNEFKKQNSLLKHIHGFDDNATCKLIQECNATLELIDFVKPL